MSPYFEKNPFKWVPFSAMEHDLKKWVGVWRLKRHTPIQTKSEHSLSKWSAVRDSCHMNHVTCCYVRTYMDRAMGRNLTRVHETIIAKILTSAVARIKVDS